MKRGAKYEILHFVQNDGFGLPLFDCAQDDPPSRKPATEGKQDEIGALAFGLKNIWGWFFLFFGSFL